MQTCVKANYKDEKRAHFKTNKQRDEKWLESINNSDEFWGKFAKENIDWYHPFDQVSSGSFNDGANICWFLNGKLNVTYNCVDRWAKLKPDGIAIIHEGNELSDNQQITFKQLLSSVCLFANVMKRNGVKKGDIVVIYMPMIPQAIYAMLAAVRIGAAHSVIFAGFNEYSIRDRILDANAKYIITSNLSFRGKKVINLKLMVDKALRNLNINIKVFIWYRDQYKYQTEIKQLKEESIMNHHHHHKYIILNDAIKKERGYISCEIMDSEDALFLLYTSGSTGKPKGVLHSSGGYLIYTMATHKYVFDIQENDIFGCVADLGWITGHSYIVYGPLSNGCTTLLFESIPTYPTPSRYWQMIEKYKITQFYTSPTAIRQLMRFNNKYIKNYDLSSLRVLGTVGEPINPETWLWYFNIVGNAKCPIIDTWWQTETGGILISAFPMTPNILKPGSATKPFFGIEPALLDKNTLQEIPIDKNNNNNNNNNKTVQGILVIKKPWPGLCRTLYGDHQRWINTYIQNGYFKTGDGAKRDKDGYYWITGRIDDVLNVSGHRIGTAEIESCVVENKYIVECAVVGIPHKIKGQTIFIYAIMKNKNNHQIDKNKIKNNIILNIKNKLGGIFKPEYIMLVDGVPKTRSGKIMRRILRKIACQQYENLGDITTLQDPQIVKQLINQRRQIKLVSKL